MAVSSSLVALALLGATAVSHAPQTFQLKTTSYRFETASAPAQTYSVWPRRLVVEASGVELVFRVTNLSKAVLAVTAYDATSLATISEGQSVYSPVGVTTHSNLAPGASVIIGAQFTPTDPFGVQRIAWGAECFTRGCGNWRLSQYGPKK